MLFRSRAHVGEPICEISSAGRASVLHAECRQFDPVITHHTKYIMRELRKLAKLVESNSGSIQQDVAAAIPALYVVPSLTNGNPYHQYRMGLAFAAARANEQGLIPKVEKSSAYGENMVLVADTEEERRTLELAFKMMGVTDYKMLTPPTSDEAKDVDTKSPVAKFVPTKRPR